MRESCYEVLLVGENEFIYPEHKVPVVDGCRNDIGQGNRNTAASVVKEQPVVCATPGQEYHVKINIYRKPNGQFPAKFIRLGLYVDGCDVQYWKRLDLSDPEQLPEDPETPVSSRFWGFKRNTSDIRSFVFSKPAVVEATHNGMLAANTMQPSLNSVALGTIKVVIFEAMVTEGIMQNRLGVHELPDKAVLSEGKKFWQQASVTTAAGRRIDSDKERFRPLQRWRNTTDQPMQVMVLQYHTSSMVDFLNNFKGQLNETGEKRKRNAVIDLTGDSDNEGGDTQENNAGSSSGKKSRRSEVDASASAATASEAAPDASLSNGAAVQTVEREEVIDADVSIVFKPKPKPEVLDITGD